MLALGLDLFSIVTGVVGTLAVLFPIYRWLLPRQRIKDLDAVVCNVECLVDTLREAGALEPMLAMPTSECLLRAHGALTEFYELRLCCVSWRKAVLLCNLHLEVGRALRELKILQKALQANKAAAPESEAPASVSNLVELSRRGHVEALISDLLVPFGLIIGPTHDA